MKSESMLTETVARKTARPTLSANVSRQLVCKLLSRLKYGRLNIQDGKQTFAFGSGEERDDLRATIYVHDPGFWSSLLLGGNIGAGESYACHEWSCDDLTALVRIMAANMDVLDSLESGIAKAFSPLRRMAHALRQNTRQGSRKNIAAHYDLGNDFFRLFLDDTMMYSSAYFPRPDATLEEASVAKLDRICQKLGLSKADHVLEIGTGWGGFAIHAASHYGCHVTTTTISREQFALAQERIEAHGLQDRITLLFKDYRDLEGQYDKLVSIEMIEAVGEKYLPVFMQQCSRLLKPSGSMLLQAIVIADQRYEHARKNVDFIKKYIFPGGHLPSVSRLTGLTSGVTDLRLHHLEELTTHYARTLRCWHERLLAHRQTLAAKGYGNQFIRLWEFYFCYCEGGFLERTIGVIQMVHSKPQARTGASIPALQAELTS